MQFEREFEIPIQPKARVLVRTGGRPVDRYAVLLQTLTNERWATVRLIDNHLGQHHMHRYHGLDKQSAEHFALGDVNAVLPEAIRYLVDTASAILDSWNPPR